MKTLLISTVTWSLIFNLIPLKSSYASSEERVVIDGEEIKLETIYEDKQIVVTGTDENKTNTVFVYNYDTNIATLDGEIVNLTFETIVEDIEETLPVVMASSAYTPVYVATSKLSFSKTINGIGAIATVIGGVIAIAAISGISLPSLATVIANWASVVGLGSLAAGYLITGSFSYKLYRTQSPVQFGIASWPQIAYRYQNCSTEFTIKGFYKMHNYTQIGSWWYAEKPY